MFDGYVFVDQVPIDSDKPAMYIYTRPFDLSSVKPRESLTLCTTALLKSVMIYGENSEVRKSIEILNDCGLPYSIELPNKEIVIIKAFSCGKSTLNFVILFEYCDRYILYAGRYITNSKILDHKYLRKKMAQNSIDDLYIDGTLAHITGINLRRSACDEIVSLVKSNENYKFNLVIDDFGYEDLLFDLAKKNIKIYLDKKRSDIFKCQQLLQFFYLNKKDADISVIDKLAEDVQTQYESQKIISIKLTTDSQEKSKDSLKIVQYPIHPTLQDIHYIVHITAPLHIYTIGAEATSLPFDLNHLCRYDENDDKEIQRNCRG